MNFKVTLRVKKKHYQAFFLICCFILSFESTLATTVTSSPSASLNQDCGGYIILDDIIFTEDVSTDFAANQTSTTYVLDFSAAGFEFKAGAGSVVHKSNRDVDASSITITVSTVTIT
ncbi:MAG: hypothetical protein JKX73_00660, partial [Flavobacteriales bacterium]|nr:hypothetical protein [Flavobacteriales bacterium]